jgi:hypothetical protein
MRGQSGRLTLAVWADMADLISRLILCYRDNSGRKISFGFLNQIGNDFQSPTFFGA